MTRRLAPLVVLLALVSCANYRLVRDGTIQTSDAEDVKARLVAIRGLRFQQPVPLAAVTSAEARTILEEELRRQYRSSDLATFSRIYQALGLLPPDTDLERSFLDLYAGQLAGFYDPIDRRMVMVSDSLDGGLMTRLLESIVRRDLTGELVLAHELTHALQDQHYGLDVGRGDVGEDDAQLARRAVYEGDATLAGFATLLGKLRPGKAVSIASRLERLPGQLASAYPDIPALIRDTVVFQYVAGVNFVSWAYQRAQWEGVNALLVFPPRSTEQVLHPEKYFVRPEYPLSIRLGAVTPYLNEGWEIVEDTTAGELIVQILGQRFFDRERAVAVASGWDGDRLTALVRGEDQAIATAWLTAWDSQQDATEFFTAYAEILAAKHPGTPPARREQAVLSLAGPRPYYLEQRDTKVLAIEGPLESDLADAADRMWRRSSYEATVPWLPMELGRVEAVPTSGAIPGSAVPATDASGGAGTPCPSALLVAPDA